MRAGAAGRRPRRPAAALGLLVLTLAACSTPPPATAPEPPPPAPRPSEPADPERRAAVRMELAAAYFQSGQLDIALQEATRAVELRPELAAAHALRALILAAQGQNAAAEQAFQRTLQLAPNDADTLHNHGWFLCQQQRYDAAEQRFAAALAVPGYRGLPAARTLLVAGVCQGRAGRWDAAEASFTRSFEIDPGNPSTAYNLADALARRGDWERARFYLRRINARAETSNALSLWLGLRAERRLGDAAAAQLLGRQLRERFPQSPEAARLDMGRFDD